MSPVGVDAPRLTSVQQWDGEAYHTVAVWEATGGETTRFVPYDTRWPFLYWNDGVLFQFDDAFVAGTGIRVREHPGLVPPAITSTPPTQGAAGVLVDYVATGTGDAPFWWSLPTHPTSARIDAASGELAFTPAAPGRYSFVVRLENDAGRAEQAFELIVPGEEDAGVGGDGGEPGSDSGTPADGGGGSGEVTGGCGCGVANGGSRGVAWLALAWALTRRGRRAL